MASYTGVEVRYPPAFPGVPRGWWYLREGFKRLGCEVIDDPGLLAEGYWSPPARLPDPVHIAVLYVNGRRVLYDCSDFAVSFPELGQPYFAKNALLSDLPEVQPIGQYLGTHPELFFEHLPELRKLTEHKTIEVLAVYSNIDDSLESRDYPNQNALEGWRNRTALRRRVVEELHGKPGAVCGLWRWSDTRPEVPEHLRVEKIPPLEHWRRIAQSKVVICLPGVGGESTRLRTEALAIGSCVVTVESQQAWPGDTSLAWHEVPPSPAEIVRCARGCYPKDWGGKYFDAHLTPEAMAARMIRASI